MTTTEGRIYFVELESLERLEVQFVPDGLEIDRVPTIAGIAVVGRNTPKYQYTGGETVMTFRLDFYASQEDRKDVISKCKWLESLMYNDGSNAEPSRVQFIWGDLFEKETWIVRNAKANYSQFNKQYGYLPQQAYVDVQLALDMDFNVRTRDIRYPFGIPASMKPTPKDN